LTDKGRKRLDNETRVWGRQVAAIARILESPRSLCSWFAPLGVKPLSFLAGQTDGSSFALFFNMCPPLRSLQNSGDGRHLPAPFSRFIIEPLSPLVRQSVILCAPVVLGGLPFALDEPIPL